MGSIDRVGLKNFVRGSVKRLQVELEYLNAIFQANVAIRISEIL